MDINDKEIITKDNTEKENRKKRKLFILLLILLLLLVSISSCGVGVLLNKYITKDNIGGIIDLKPEKSAPAQYFMISGVVKYEDGNPAAGMKIELHSIPKYTTTNKNGAFYFKDVENGKHTISVLDDSGNVLCSKEIEISVSDGIDTKISLNADGVYCIEIPVQVQLLELQLEIDKETGEFTINQKNFGTVDYGGTYKYPSKDIEYNPKPGSKQYIITPSGVVVLPGGTLILPGGSGESEKPIVIMPDGTIPGDNSLSELGIERQSDGSILLPGGAVAKNNGDVVNLDGNKIEPGTEGVLVDGDSGSDDNKNSMANDKSGSTTGGNANSKSISENGKVTNGSSSKESENGGSSGTSGNTGGTGGTKDNSGASDNTGMNDNPGTSDDPGTSDEPGASDDPGTSDDPGVSDDPEEDKTKSPSGNLSIAALYGTKSIAWTQTSNVDLFYTEDGREMIIQPGSDGNFLFQLNNTRKRKLNVTITITEPENGKHLPLVFNLTDQREGITSEDTKLNNGEKLTLNFIIGYKTKNIYCLHWEWPFESGNDEYDTLMGNLGGAYILNISLYVEEIL